MQYNTKAMREIHDSMINGQREQAAEQMQEYGLYDALSDYAVFLADLYTDDTSQHKYFRDAACILVRALYR